MPRFQIIADLHTHTLHSHAANSTEEMYEAGRNKGLRIIGFSEHSPRPQGYIYPADYQDKLNAGFPDYVKEVLELKDNDDGVKVLLGVEVDFIPTRQDFARETCQAYDYDYILGGLHFQGEWGFDRSAKDWDKLNQAEKFAVYEQYYRDLKIMAESGLVNIAAHPDLPKLFTVNDFTLWLQKDKSLDLIRETLKAFKANSVALEISSAGLRKACKEIYPAPAIMKIAKELKLAISFGSDAHCVNTPAFAFDKLAAYAAEYGFSKSVYFQRKEALEIPFIL